MSSKKKVRCKGIEALDFKSEVEKRLSREIYNMVLNEFERRYQEEDHSNVTVTLADSTIFINLTGGKKEVVFEENNIDYVSAKSLFDSVARQYKKAPNFSHIITQNIFSPEKNLTIIRRRQNEQI